MKTGFAAAINDQGRFAPTCVGDFNFVPEANAHVWKSKIVESAAELVECANGAIASVAVMGSPYITLRFIQVGSPAVEAPVEEDSPTPESVKAALLATNGELRNVIASPAPRGRPSLALVEDNC